MKITKRERFLLKQSLDFNVHRYILSKRRMNGFERAEVHIEIAKTIYQFIYCHPDTCRDWDEIMLIHDKLTAITDHLDKYGFDIHDAEQDTYPITEKVMEALIEFTENYGGKDE